MTDITAIPDDPPVIAGETGFVISLDWEADSMIDRILGIFADVEYMVAVTPHLGDAFDAKVSLDADDSGRIVFVPWNIAADTPVPDAEPVPYVAADIDGVHVY